MKAKRYPNLHRVAWTSNWVFRKHSSAKRKEFVKSTGIEATEANAPKAYKRGVELFNDWLGVYLPSGRQVLIKDIARAVMASKDTRSVHTARSTRSQIRNHILPAFGHLRPDQVTSLVWKNYDTEERRKGKRKALFNTRKALMECLHRAHAEGVIRRVPDLELFDPEAAPPKHLDAATVRRIRRALPGGVKLLAFIMAYQGARPGEVLKYRWSMIRWNEGAHGMLDIPGAITKTRRSRSIPLNSRVSRALRVYRRHAQGDAIIPSRKDVNAPLSAYNAVWDRAMARLGMGYTIYNLRDTWITNQLIAGMSDTFIGKYCDTSAEMIRRKYAVAVGSVMAQIAG